MNPELHLTVKNSLRRAGKILVLLFIAVHAFNVDYQPVTGGIDASWQYIINDAARHRIEFSFTSGPLGFINYPLNVGTNLEIAVGVRLFCWLAFVGFFSYLAWRNYFPLRNLAVFAFLFALGSSLPFDYFLCLVTLFLLTLAMFVQRWRWCYALVIGIAAVLGLIKLSAALLAISACVIFTGIMVFLDQTKALQAAFLTIVGIPSLFSAFYLLYDPSFPRMSAYLRRAWDISAGYNVAMSMSGRPLALWLAFGMALAYLGLLGLLRKSRDPAFWPALMFLPPLFFAFKHGFVRQDGHETIFFAFMPLILGLLLLFTSLRKIPRWGMVLLVPALLPHFLIAGYTTNLTHLLGVSKMAIMRELINYPQTKAELQTISAEFLRAYQLPPDWVETIGAHTVSIFPWETAYAPANHLNYRPFPVIQAYSAYTAYLDEVNARFLEDPAAAPDFILMEWVAINGRHALMDVPAMWLALYAWYDVALQRNAPFPLALLKRRATPRFQTLEPLEHREYRREDFISLPVSAQPVVMTIALRLNLLGTLAKAFFRVPEVTLDLVGAGGYRTYRIIPETLNNLLLINFLPISLADVAFFENDQRTRGKIYGFRLSGEGLPLYQKTMQVAFYTIPGIPVNEFHPLDLSALTVESAAAVFNVEQVSTYTPKQTVTPEAPPSFLIVKGWAVDAKAGAAAGGVYLDLDGKLVAAYYGFPREDVAANFNRPAYKASGFQAGIPISAIGKGRHTLSLKILTHDQKAYYAPAGNAVFEIK